ncbi:MAG: peptidase domain-containing ABC transporter [Chitinophagaceae bacterium]
MSFVFYKQLNAMDCGPTCLRMIAKHYGKHFNTDVIRQVAGYNKAGVNLLGLSEAAEKIGFRTRGVQISYKQLSEAAPYPCILHWQQNHFVVCVKRKKNFLGKETLIIADPAKGILGYSKEEFQAHWISTNTDTGERVGTVLLMEPSSSFYEQKNEKKNKISWSLLFQYLRKSKWQISQIFIALLITSILQLIFPLLMQSIVDIGINTQNLQFITIILIAQLTLVFSRTVVDFIRSRLLLRVSTVVNLSILSDFWIKLTGLPVSYFENFHTGDTLQRINDNKQIQTFLTGNALNTLFSIVTFVIYASVLLLYNKTLFLIFAIGSALYFIWIRLFLKVRRKINAETFRLSSNENNATLQLVQGMRDIKLNNAEQLKRWEWENVQTSIFKLSFKNLSYSQIQQAGALFINQGKDVVITFFVAQLVIHGQLTLGEMLAIQYIIGQLTSPIEQMVSFVQSAQDAKISLERLNEVHQLDDEEDAHKTYSHHLPENKSIRIGKLSFTYPGAGNDPVLKDIELEIVEGKTTAIVGASGSGKTTLLKLLLKFYDSYKGDIKIGNADIKYMSPYFWRKQCGAVLQDGFIFNDSIAKNIAVGEESPDYMKLEEASKVANILSFIESLPNGFDTKLGSDGVGISQGQRQRILIARAIYKDPHYLFFDEATNALDANNEKAIVENLQGYFIGRTVVVVAHRLSTVKRADKIIVLHEGKIVEEGTHHQLSGLKGKYFELVRNQLELGN